jgi:hypothetical protein
MVGTAVTGADDAMVILAATTPGTSETLSLQTSVGATQAQK